MSKLSKPEVTMWRTLAAEFIKHSGDAGDELELADGCDYYPIDNNTCLIMSMVASHLAERSGLSIIKMLEVECKFLFEPEQS